MERDDAPRAAISEDQTTFLAESKAMKPEIASAIQELHGPKFMINNNDTTVTSIQRQEMARSCRAELKSASTKFSRDCDLQSNQCAFGCPCVISTRLCTNTSRNSVALQAPFCTRSRRRPW
jgi:hypothetical protein